MEYSKIIEQKILPNHKQFTFFNDIGCKTEKLLSLRTMRLKLINIGNRFKVFHFSDSIIIFEKVSLIER